MKHIQQFFFTFTLLFFAQSLSAQWFFDEMPGISGESAPSPFINTAPACNPPGVTNLGVTVVGIAASPVFVTGWDGFSTNTTSVGSCISLQNQVGVLGNTGATFTYTLQVTGSATISSMTFGARRNSFGHPNVGVKINGTSYTPSVTNLSGTGWFPISVPVSPALTVTAGNNIVIELTFTGGTTSSGGGVIQRIDRLSLFGSTAAPVELSEFIVKPAPVGFELNWKTSTEKDNQYFAVERSGNGQLFTEIARVTGAGNSTTEQSYQFTDLKPLKGNNYYRLKQVDIDGRTDFSPVRHVTLATDFSVAIAPNPVLKGNATSVQFTIDEEDVVHLTVLNQLGQLVLQQDLECQKGDNTFELPSSSTLPQGVYTLQMSTSQQRLATQQFVIR